MTTTVDYSDRITAPYPPTPTSRVEHERCDADDCDRVVCLCDVTDGLPCPGTVERGCGHPGAIVCDAHRLDACQGCRDNARDDAEVLR